MEYEIGVTPNTAFEMSKIKYFQLKLRFLTLYVVLLRRSKNYTRKT